MTDAVREAVRQRAMGRCEYCQRPDESSALRFTMDHIVARQHGGSDGVENLAWACASCNRRKGPNLTGIDPQTGSVVRLFNPRAERWADHFSFEREMIVGRTDVGRATVVTLGLNLAHQIAVRRSLVRDRLMEG